MHQRIDRATTAGLGGRTTGGPPRVPSLRARLVLLVMSLLLPALAASAFLIWDSSRQAYRIQERQLVATSRTLSLVVDRQLSEQTGLLNALAASYRLEQGDWADFDQQARRALAGSQSWVTVRDAEGRQLVNTLRPRGAELPRVSNPRVPPNRPPRADGVRIAPIANGAIAREPVVLVVKAVRLAGGREVDLGVVTRAAVFSDVLRRQALPAGWTATILDGSHRVVARNHDEARFRGVEVSAALSNLFTPGASGVISARTLDGVTTRAAYAPVEDCDWTAIVAVPRSELEAPAVRALAAGALVALILLLAGVVTASRAASRITQGVGRLQAAVAGGVDAAFVAPRSSRVAEIDALAAAFGEAALRAREHDGQQQLLINELNHRVKNTLATLQSVASHSRRSAVTVDEFHAALEGRIMAMSGAHELLTNASWSSADLEQLARTALRPFEGPRLVIEGPRVQVQPTDALNLTLIFYELATNAAKYGALSGAAGTATLRWERDGDVVRIHWAESGGPPVEAHSREGFGSRLIHKARQALHPSEFHFDSAGVRCSLTLRARAVGG